MSDLLLREARLVGGDGPVDVRVREGRVVEVAPGGTLAEEGAEPVAVSGRVLLPGLWDAHVHFTQWTIQRSRFDLSGTASARQALERTREVLRVSPPEAGAVVTGYGFRDGVWPDAPTRVALDEVAGSTAVVLISGDLHCAWMSSAAADRFGLDLDETGVVREGPWSMRHRS